MATERRNIQVLKTTHKRYTKLSAAEAKRQRRRRLEHDEFMTLLQDSWEQSLRQSEIDRDRAIGWYSGLLNDLMNDDNLKRIRHYEQFDALSELYDDILRYAREAAGLTEEDVEIKEPISDIYVPHDSNFIVEHITPEVHVTDKPPFEEGQKWTNQDGSTDEVIRNEGPTSVVQRTYEGEQEPKQ